MGFTNLQVPSDKKFVELLLYVASRSETDENYGAVKLNKILFYSDFLSYQATGKSITGHVYKKLPKGPVPKALLPILDRLKVNGDVDETHREYFGHMQKRVIAKRSPDLSVFTAAEIATVDRVLAALKGGNATQVSDLSHEFLGWKAANLNEEIPYQTALIDERPEPDERDIAFAISLHSAASRYLAGPR